MTKSYFHKPLDRLVYDVNRRDIDGALYNYIVTHGVYKGYGDTVTSYATNNLNKLEAEKYIGNGLTTGRYTESQVPKLPAKITYKNDTGYTNTYQLAQSYTQFQGIQIPDQTIEQRNGTAALSNIYRYQLAETDAPQLDTGIIFAGPLGAEGASEVKSASTAVNEVKPYDITKYRPSNSPLENHHGVMDVWATENVPGYVSRAPDSPAMALTEESHNATRSEFMKWKYETYGSTTAKVDWKNVSPQEIQSLSDRMFNAAKAPADAISNYYRAFNQYIYNLR